MFSLLFEIPAAVDEEPGEPGEVVDGGTNKWAKPFSFLDFCIKSSEKHRVFLVFERLGHSGPHGKSPSRSKKHGKNLRFSHTFCGFMTLDSEVTLPNHGKTLCFHSFSAESIEQKHRVFITF